MHLVDNLSDGGSKSLEIQKTVIRTYEEYFNIKYALPKLDSIAVPDLPYLAMENYGLVTYKDYKLLYYENISAVSDVESQTRLIAHETAHQWFGNYVTELWWNDLWLSEGFAEFFQFMGIEAMYPDFDMEARFLNKALQNVMEKDSLISISSVTMEIQNPAKESNHFEIIYHKGSTLIRMMRNFMGDQKFKQGLVNYLNKYKLGNADRQMLYYELGTLSNGLKVGDIMESWMIQPGYPLIKVINSTDDSVYIKQERYFRDEDISDTSSWWIPITITTVQEGFNDTICNLQWLKDRKINKVHKSNNESPYIMNVQEMGYYRVDYDLDNWRKISNQLKSDHETIHRLNRAQIVDDVLNLAISGDVSYDLALDIASYLKHENDLIPLSSGLKNLKYIGEMFKGSVHTWNKVSQIYLGSRKKHILLIHFGEMSINY